MRISIPATTAMDAARLLEFAASDDVESFRRAVEEEGVPIDAPSAWYGRWSSSTTKKAPTMGFELRTPLMMAALYGSISVLEYIISSVSSSDVNFVCGSDSTTALHCAVAGGSPASLRAVKRLLDAYADVDAVDAAGNKPLDLVTRQKPSTKARSALELALGGGDRSVKDDEEFPVTPKQQEKKEYPVDATLPDIKSGIYLTDEFRMYTFKVKPCSRAYSHDWTECPFVHPGENARRRDPRKYHYSCVPCPDFRKGSCRHGDACEYAHGVFESWLHPAQYRTRLCKDETGCNRRVCFFAHKPEELRPLYPSSGSPGSVVSSPRSGLNLPPLDLGAAAAALLLNQQPMSPSSSSALAAAVWLNQTAGVMTTPTMQLPSSRLKSALNARDLDLDFELLGLDGYQQLQQQKQQQKQQQQLIDEIGNLSLSRGSDYGDIYGSPDSTLISSLAGLSLKQSVAAASQFQSPTPAQKHQNLTQQLLSGYATAANLPSSPSGRASSPSLASAIMNSRASAFAKRSQSFIDRGAMSRHSGGIPVPTSMPTANPTFSNWGSPNGKVDWGIQGEELNKLRKSSSFGLRSNGSIIAGAAPTFTSASEEPDVSWVQSIVKDEPTMEQQQLQQRKTQFHLSSGAGEFHPAGVLSSWADQLYMEQEQLVA